MWDWRLMNTVDQDQYYLEKGSTLLGTQDRPEGGDIIMQTIFGEIRVKQ